MTDWKALCAELLAALEVWEDSQNQPLIDCVRTALAEGDGPTDERLTSLKEQALKELAWVDKYLDMPLHNHCNAIYIIRRALEALPGGGARPCTISATEAKQ